MYDAESGVLKVLVSSVIAYSHTSIERPSRRNNIPLIWCWYSLPPCWLEVTCIRRAPQAHSKILWSVAALCFVIYYV